MVCVYCGRPGYVSAAQDAQSYFSDVYRQIFVAVVAFGIALVLLLLFKLYEPIGVAMLSSMFLTVITFAIRIGIRILISGRPFGLPASGISGR